MTDFDIPTSGDSRSVDELVNAALTEPDDSAAWDAVAALHWRGTADVLSRAIDLIRSRCSRERYLGADILGQLGVPRRTFPTQCVAALLTMLRGERDPAVLRSILVALSHLQARDAIPAVAALSGHGDPEVRHAVVLALTGHDDALALSQLVGLTRDRDPHVRDWATFALGTQTDADTPQLRDALVERLTDEDEDTRAEAMIGLARRKDRRALPAIERELSAPEPMPLAIEAAERIEAPELLTALRSLRGSDAIDIEALEQAIAACRGD